MDEEINNNNNNNNSPQLQQILQYVTCMHLNFVVVIVFLPISSLPLLHALIFFCDLVIVDELSGLLDEEKENEEDDGYAKALSPATAVSLKNITNAFANIDNIAQVSQKFPVLFTSRRSQHSRSPADHIQK